LKDRFKECGDVKYAEIQMENGRSRGMGFVKYGNMEEAEKAVDMMNGARFGDREVEVKID